MAEVTIEMIKVLREKTGAGIALCKEALVSCDGNGEQAELFIRKKDKDKAAKRAERATGEGFVFVRISDTGTTGILAEMGCETDFVARNEQFQELGKNILDALEAAGDFSNVLDLPAPDGKALKDHLEQAVATIGENMKLKRVARLKAENGCIGFYSHFNNKAASLVALSLEGVDGASEAVQALGRDVCMHITSCRPTALTSDDIPADVIAKEKEVYMEEVKTKPEKIQDKIMAGKLQKFFSTTCLGEQNFVKDESIKIKDQVTAVLKEAGGTGKITGFARLELGSSAVCINGEKAELDG